MRINRESRTGGIPFPSCREFAKAYGIDDDCLRRLREAAKTGADPLSAARAVAYVYADLIASSHRFLIRVREIEFLFLEEELSFQETIRRTTCFIRMVAQIQAIMLEAIDGYLACFGGTDVIALEATAQWIRKQQALAPNGAAQPELNQVLKIMLERSAKKGPCAKKAPTKPR